MPCSYNSCRSPRKISKNSQVTKVYLNAVVVCVSDNNILLQPQAESVRRIKLPLAGPQLAELATNLHRPDLVAGPLQHARHHRRASPRRAARCRGRRSLVGRDGGVQGIRLDHVVRYHRGGRIGDGPEAVHDIDGGGRRVGVRMHQHRRVVG